MKVIQNASGQLFAGWAPTSGNALRYKPKFVLPTPTRPAEVAVYESDEDAEQAASDIKRYDASITVVIGELISKAAGAPAVVAKEGDKLTGYTREQCAAIGSRDSAPLVISKDEALVMEALDYGQFAADTLGLAEPVRSALCRLLAKRYGELYGPRTVPSAPTGEQLYQIYSNAQATLCSCEVDAWDVLEESERVAWKGVAAALKQQSGGGV